MKYFTRHQLLTLKAKIKGLAAEGSRTRKILHTKTGSKRDYYWGLKRTIGYEARYHLIAYGLLRGIPYDKIEPNSNRHLRALLDYSYLLQIIHSHHPYPYRYGKEWTPKVIQEMLLPSEKEAA